MGIPNWGDPTSRVTDHFSVHECCWLPSWGVLHLPNEFEQANLLQTCQLLEKVRDFLGHPLNIHCMLRPRIVNAKGSVRNFQDYNSAVGGARQSAHIVGLAADFDAGQDCDETRALLLPKLEEWGCRCEDRPGSNWIHLDLAPVINNRFFKP